MKIAICDDDKTSCVGLERILLEIDSFAVGNNIIDIYYSGNRLIKGIEHNNSYDIIFLDIEMKPINGIEVGKHIREIMHNNIIQIIYISHNENYAMELFDIRPFNFIIKPFIKEKVVKVYFEAQELINSNRQVFLYQKETMTVRKFANEIIYFESDNRKINIITCHGRESFYGKMEDIICQLGENHFLHIHKSYYINYFHVKKISYDKVIMSNNVVLNISQSRRKNIRKQHLAFMNWRI